MAEIPELDILVDLHKPIEAIKEIVKQIRPTWSISNMKVEDKSTGFVNKNYKVYDSVSHDAFLLRAMNLGHNPHLIVLQKLQHRFVHDQNLGPKMYCSLKNGVCIEFIKGKTMSWDERKGMYDSEMRRQTAEIMAEYHTKALYESGQKCDLHQRDTNKFDQFVIGPLNMMKNKDPESEFCRAIPSGDEVMEERDWFLRTAKKLMLEKRVTHLDPNPTNWLVRDEDSKVLLIDYDMISIFYPCADLAWFFLLHTDIRKVDLAEYPSIEYQRKWLAHYLAKRRELDGDCKPVTYDDVDELIDEVEFGLLFAYLQVVIGGVLMRLMHAKTGSGEISEQTVLVCWEAYQKKKAEYVCKGYV